MNIILNRATQGRRASALLLTAVVLVFTSAVLVTYLLLTQNEFGSVSRSQTWNTSMVLTEAGVEDALAFMNKYSGNITKISDWSSSDSALEDGWAVNGNIYSIHRVVDPNVGYYDVSIDNTITNAPVITCSGTAYAKLLASVSPHLMFAAAGVSTPSADKSVRSVMVKTTFASVFPGAISTRTNIDLNGNNVRVDSFDSTTNAASAWITSWGYGVYDVNKARANGDVVTDSSLVGAISVGQANIYGHLNTGPGGSATIGNNGYVGPLPQVGSGIQPGYSKDDMNVIFPDVVLPSGAKFWNSVPASNIITNSGNYICSGLYSSLTIQATNVTVYIQGSISLSGYDAIIVGTNVNKATIYLSGPTADFHGQSGINNLTKNAHRLRIYGLPSLTSVDLGGNVSFTGTIYAPSADFAFSGSGNDQYDFVGSLVANSCRLNGNAQFHYDESLKRSGPGIGYIPASWLELTAPGQ